MVIRNSYYIKIQLMAYRTSLTNKYYNSEYVVVVDFDDEYFYLKNSKWCNHKDIYYIY